MKEFDPIEVMIQFGAAPPSRMIFYPKDGSFSEKETQAIADFKSFCKTKKFKVPEIDNEILRMLYKRKWNN